VSIQRKKNSQKKKKKKKKKNNNNNIRGQEEQPAGAANLHEHNYGIRSVTRKQKTMVYIKQRKN
jgi:hypothetical protein